MEVVRLLAHTVSQVSATPSVIAIGNFDGVHAGHAHVLAVARAHAHALNVPLSVLTFTPHPREFFQPSTRPWPVFPLADRLRLLRDAGVDRVWLQRFDADFAATAAHDFAQLLLAQHLRAVHVVTGENFVFGAGRAGNAMLLEQWLAAQQVGYTPVAIHHCGGGAISSTAIRRALAAGNMAQVAAALGRPYASTGRVVHGRKMGRGLGYPTANIALSPRHWPATGIYAVWVQIEGEAHWRQAAANFGRRPMFDNGPLLLEAHVLDAPSGFDVYGKRVRVVWGERLRQEAVFETVDALCEQMAHDCAVAREWLSAHPIPHLWAQAMEPAAVGLVTLEGMECR
jgi:riboflavin kinase / FMN adenylyltransferase